MSCAEWILFKLHLIKRNAMRRLHSNSMPPRSPSSCAAVNHTNNAHHELGGSVVINKGYFTSDAFYELSESWSSSQEVFKFIVIGGVNRLKGCHPMWKLIVHQIEKALAIIITQRRHALKCQSPPEMCHQQAFTAQESVYTTTFWFSRSKNSQPMTSEASTI